MSRYPFPLPFGWYLLADDRWDGDPLALHRFDRHLRLQRGPRGDAELVDPADDRRWPTEEQHGLVFAWHHPLGDEPAWALPDLAPFDGPAAPGTIEAETRVEIDACLQEITENGYDHAHLEHVHGTAPSHEVSFTPSGHEARLEATLSYATARGEMRQVIDNRSHGPGFGIVHFSGIVDTWFLAAGTPITADRTDVWFRYRFRAPDGGPADQRMVDAYLAEIERQYRQDTVIWEHKAYLARPALTEGEGLITRFRRWYAQFYVDGAAAAPTRSSDRTVWPPPAPSISSR